MEQLLYRIQYYDDQRSFREFYQLQVFKLFQFAYAFVKNKEVSEELVNDVFLVIWQKRSGLDKIANINVYLYKAVKNRALNYLRTIKGYRLLSLDHIEVNHFHLSPDPECIFITSELQKMIAVEISRLPPRCKLIFKLVKEDNLSYKEVAEILNISTKTVDTQLTIAIKKLSVTIKPVLNGSSNISRTP